MRVLVVDSVLDLAVPGQAPSDTPPFFFLLPHELTPPPPLAQAKDTRLEELESECAQLREMIAAQEREQARPSGVPQPLEPRIGIEHPVMEEISPRLHTQLLLFAGSSERILKIY